MSTAPEPAEPSPTDFDRIVAGLRATTPGPHRPRPVRPVGNLAFVVGWLAVIVPMSTVVGGWIGLTALFTSSMVAARLLSEPHRRGRP